MPEEEERLLAAFLAEPLASNPRGRYRAWLDERGFRGEYLGLLLNELDEPTAPCPGGSVRERIRELRGQIATDWAEPVDKTRLVMDGLYQSIPSPEGWNYLRFSPDGTVLSLCSTETAGEVWQRLNSANDLSGFCCGSYTLRAAELSFSLPYRPPENLLQEWQALKEKLCSSYKPHEGLVREWEALQQVPRDRDCGSELDRELDSLERQMDIRTYQAELDERMKRLSYSGALGPRTLCLQWQSAFADTYSGVTTFWLAVATGTARLLTAQPSEKPGERVPKVGPVRVARPSEGGRASVPEGDRNEQENTAKTGAKTAPIPAGEAEDSSRRRVEISLSLDQQLSPPCYRRVGVEVRGDLGTAVVSSSTARRLAAALESDNPFLAARLREISDEVSSRTGPRDDPGDETEAAEDSLEQTDLAYRVLGIERRKGDS